MQSTFQIELWIEEQVKIYWKQLQDQHVGLKYHTQPKIQYMRNPSRIAGKAWWRKSYSLPIQYGVKFNLTYAITVPREEFTATIVHELAHVVQYLLFPDALQSHGKEFRLIMKSVGFSPDTYHEYNVKAAKEAASKAKVSISWEDL